MAQILNFPDGKPWDQPRTIADALQDLQDALDTFQRIILGRAETCWTATFHGFNGPPCPNGVPIPLPFTPQADFNLVAEEMLRRYPHAFVTGE